MIVSGFTQKDSGFGMADDSNVDVAGQHSHCVRCRQVNCSQFVDNVTACVMVTCESCSWRCHECKFSEHILTCPEERVPCVNKEYGCPHVLKRSKIASHLSVCPASVVCCVEEWSRWPMHARDKGVRMPLPKGKINMDCGQLDVGLAMRDQRMLIDSLRAPRKLRRTLRNALTQKYPAAPLTHRSTSFDSDAGASEDTSQTVSDDEADAPWDLSKPHPGLKESIRSRLFRVTKETTDSLAAALDMTSGALSTQNRLSGISESADVNEAKDELDQIKLPDVGNMQTRSVSRSLSPSSNSGISDKSMGSPVPENLTKPSGEDEENTLDKAAAEQKREYMDGFVKPVDSGVRITQSTERSIRSSVSSDRFSDSSTKSKTTLHDMGGTQLHKLLGIKPEQDQESEICLHKILGVDLNFDCINKYVSKPSSMYTFICAQNFRRDEYRWHFKNIHQEIHPGLGGWLEQRCPLAYLGCTFSFVRLEPAQPDVTLHYSWLQNSFGLRSNKQPQLMPMTAEHQQNIMENQKTNQDFVKCESPGGPSISDLAQIDKDFNLIPSGQSKCNSSNKNEGDGLIGVSDKNDGAEATSHSGISAAQRSTSNSQERDTGKKNYMRVRPTIYTASNWDSKVLFQYDVEEEGEDETLGVSGFCPSLTNLPFEIIQQIAKHLDSFSLCNLALTCRLLRDVCCSLLDDHGIVLLNWERQMSEVEGEFKWRVVNKRWLFSTSFEPIRSWKFTKNQPNLGDHLKVCPFNKDIVQHDQPFKIMHGFPEDPVPIDGTS